LDTADLVVIGAGVIGLAVARAAARAGREVLVVEANGQISAETSSRNSGVIHAGLYYPADSLMARACVEGRKRLYAFCAEHGVETRRCGKLVVAVDEADSFRLDDIAARARRNGVDDLRRIGPAELAAMEPALRGREALFSPSTGVIDSHGYMLALQGEAEAAGAVVVLRSPVEGGRVTEDGVELRFGGAAPFALKAANVINAAGLRASQVAASLEGFPAEQAPELFFTRGMYAALQASCPFRHLIYPIPEPGGLGVHLTLDLAGRGRFGPDVERIDRVDYRVDETRLPRFYAAIRRYWPDLPDGALVGDYAGVRPKLAPPGRPQRDFLIQGPAVHGAPGLVNLFGIESPGLTASLVLADEALQALG
jgi:L-2-hydroxyglutarate oxidase LhgO